MSWYTTARVAKDVYRISAPLGVIEPRLQAMVRALLDRRHVHAARPQSVRRCLEVVHFQAEVPVRRPLRWLAHLTPEQLDEVPPPDVQIHPESLALVIDEVERVR